MATSVTSPKLHHLKVPQPQFGWAERGPEDSCTEHHPEGHEEVGLQGALVVVFYPSLLPLLCRVEQEVTAAKAPSGKRVKSCADLKHRVVSNSYTSGHTAHVTAFPNRLS